MAFRRCVATGRRSSMRSHRRRPLCRMTGWRPGRQRSEWAASPSSSARAPPGAWSACSRSASGPRPHQFGRLLRNLAGLDGFESRAITEPGLAGAALERLLALHDRRWAAQGGSDAMTRPSIRDFHRRVVPALAERGMVRFEELWVEGACRATYYGFTRGDHYWLYQTGYDPSWARKSVAFVRMGLSIKEWVDRGARFYDFLRGTETYKFDWALGARVTLKVEAVGARPAARLLATGRQLRAAVEKGVEAIVPRRSLDLLRRWRRARERGREEAAPTLALPRTRAREQEA